MRKTTLRLIAATLAITVMFVSASAAPDNGAAKEALKKGSYSLQFSVNQNFTIGSYEGSTLSIKRHSSDKSAYRAAIDVLASQRDEKDKRTAREQKRTSFEVDLALEFLHYLKPAKRLSPYIGAGPLFGYSHSTDEYITPSPLSNPTSKSDGWSLGAVAIFGVEWFATSGISLFAEYGTGATYTSTTNKTSDDVNGLTGQLDTTLLTLKGRGARLGLSIYF